MVISLLSGMIISNSIVYGMMVSVTVLSGTVKYVTVFSGKVVSIICNGNISIIWNDNIH